MDLTAAAPVAYIARRHGRRAAIVLSNADTLRCSIVIMKNIKWKHATIETIINIINSHHREKKVPEVRGIEKSQLSLILKKHVRSLSSSPLCVVTRKIVADPTGFCKSRPKTWRNILHTTCSPPSYSYWLVVIKMIAVTRPYYSSGSSSSM